MCGLSRVEVHRGFVPLTLMGKGRASNVQNELVGGGGRGEWLERRMEGGERRAKNGRRTGEDERGVAVGDARISSLSAPRSGSGDVSTQSVGTSGCAAVDVGARHRAGAD